MNIGKQYKGNDDPLIFCEVEDLENKAIFFDILHVNTAIQYVEKWKDLFGKLLSFAPQYIVLTRLLSGNSSTLITEEMVIGKKTPCIIINLEEFLAFFKHLGYAMIFISECEGKLSFDKKIPRKYQIPCALNLILEKI